MIRSSTLIGVSEASDVAAARRASQECAFAARFSEQGAGKLALVVTELATNLVKHGGGGSIIIGSDDEEPRTLDVTAIDKGPGIASLPAAMRDGYSTAGSPGTGLGAIARHSSQLDVYSHPGQGTAIFCAVDDEGPAPPTRDELNVAGICVPKHGELAVGDAWASMRGRDDVTVLIADGLGHGSSAAEASTRAVGVFRERERATVEEILRDLHGPLRPTRGAAVSVARIHPKLGKVEFAGVGNVSGAVVDENACRRTVCHSGTVGAEMRKVQVFTYPWTAGSVLVMHSDGLSASWSFETYPGLLHRTPAVIAAVLFRDFCRGRDDATVVVAKA